MRKFIFIAIFLFSGSVFAGGYNVFGLGVYDIKFDGSETNQALDLRFEKRLDYSLLTIGPESYDFFELKPLFGIEATSDSASYILAGIYLEDDAGDMLTGKSSNFIFTPSFSIGYYDEGDGKKLGNDIEFRTSLEFTYQLKNKSRIGISFSHISNANLGDKNPGVEIINFVYQIPY